MGDDHGNSICFAGGFLLALAISIVVGSLSLKAQRYDTRKEMQQEAIKAGVAGYVPGENGEPVFQWRRGHE